MASPVRILLVEDDKVDVMNVQRAFRQRRLRNALYVVGNGAEALDFLHHRGRFADPKTSPRPGIILLDLNMPVMNGIEFLHAVKSDEQLRLIPVIVLTTSADEHDRVESYGLGVAGYIVKPMEFPKFVEALATIDMYWELCELP
ncbi:MAG: response regulator [Planctomycetota bacterium]|nr:MAG: response regulator [Planctomycetota bacterium]